MSICNHEFIGNTGIKCDDELGHEQHHSCYSEISSSKNEAGFKVYEWNDAGQKPIVAEEMGVAISVNHNDGHKERQKIMNLAIFDATKTLPKGTVFEVRAKVLPEACLQGVDFCRVTRTKDEMAKDWGIAWYYVPKVIQPAGFESLPDLSTKTEPLFENDVDDGELIDVGEYLLLARIKV
jgi:hypothetical protein